MSTSDAHSNKIMYLFAIVIIALSSFKMAESCDASGISRCQQKMMDDALKVDEHGGDKNQICVLLDKMRDCMIKEARCPEESMKEAFELIKPGLRERFDIRCDGCATKASLSLLCLVSFYWLIRQRQQ